MPTLAAALTILCVSCSGRNGKDVRMSTLEQVTEVMDRHSDELIRLEGVVGIAVAAFEDSSLYIQVLVRERTPEMESRIPDTIEGVPVVVEESGEIVPMEDGDGAGS
jgi:hypothetical protein